MNVVQELTERLRVSLSRRGYTLHRYQTNIGRHGVSITYAAHPVDMPRPPRSAQCYCRVATLDQLEGKTAACAAYRALSRALGIWDTGPTG